MIVVFVLLQVFLLFFMLFHDWIPVPPFNDIPALKKNDSNAYRLMGSVVNGVFVFIPLVLSWVFYHNGRIVLGAAVSIFFFYLFLTLGTILSWWVPYFRGSSEKHRQAFAKFKNTHTFLPPRGNHVIPNTLHVVLHVQVWLCLFISIYYLFR